MKRTLAITSALAIGGCTLLDLDPLADGAASTSGAGGATTTRSVSVASSATSGVSTTAAVTATTTTTTLSTADATSSSAGMIPLLTDCVLLLHMDEAAWDGDGAVIDASGEDNHGTAVAGAAPGPGRFAGGAVFTGTETIVVPHAPSLQATLGLTYMAWVRPEGLDGDPGILAKRIGFQDQAAFTLFLSHDAEIGGATWFGDVEATRFHANVVATIDAWHHVAVVYDASRPATERVHLLLDGALTTIAPGPAMLAPNTVAITIGNLPNGGSYFTGTVDEVAVWRRALSDAEVATIATSDAPL
jgi:hypothetical protein